jgi:predicted dehydrogenase
MPGLKRDPLKEPRPLDLSSDFEERKADYLSEEYTPACRWAVIGTGRVCHDFVQSLKLLPSASLVACAIRSSSSASATTNLEAFATKHNIPNSFSSIEDLLASPVIDEIDIVFVAILSLYRLGVAIQFLEAGKNLLIQAPIALSKVDATTLLDFADGKGLFLSESMPSRYYPSTELARKEIKNGRIGEVVSVTIEHHINADDTYEYPHAAIYDRKLLGSGGATNYM